jgi:peptide/nickel transport system substrate-binding protein
VGGKIVIAGSREPDILDPALTTTSSVLRYLGSAIVSIDHDGNYVPYLAESWEFSDDGLTWTFNLRDDVLFHDGTPMTAHDYVWTFNRAIDPELGSPTQAGMIASVSKFSAPDDYTLVMEFASPNGGMLFSLADPGYSQPLLQAAVEAGGLDYGRNPVSVGPWKFKEWVTGDHLTFVRNPDFNWGPAQLENQGAPYIEELEFRFIPEYATILAGLEVEEIDYFAGLQPQDLEMVQGLETYDIVESLGVGIVPAVFWDVTKPPFDDLKVRQALSYAVNRQVMLDLIHPGYGEIQYGPLNRAMMGYWEGIEDLGYKYDLEKAKQLMEEAGYTMGADGILEKDGEKLSFTLPIGDLHFSYQKTAEILQSQWAELGVDIQIEQVDTTALVSQFFGGEIPVLLLQIDWTEGGELMFIGFHSQSFNLSKGQDEVLDELLVMTRSAANPADRQEAINNAAKYIVENAYMISFTAKPDFFVLNGNVKGAVFNPFFANFDEFIDAYYE